MNSFRSMGGLVARLTVGVALFALASAAQAAVEKGSASVITVQGGAGIFDRRHDMDITEAGRESSRRRDHSYLDFGGR